MKIERLCLTMVLRRGLDGSYRFMVRLVIMVAVLVLSSLFPAGPAGSQTQALNPNPPSATVRLVFIHHSVGENMLNAGLFGQLNGSNYYVTDTYYGWGPEDDGAAIGDHTDIGQWYNWFGPSSATFLDALYNNAYIREDLVNSMEQPAGPNTVVLFKSCFPNSGGISGNPSDSPRLSSLADPNPIWGATAYDSDVVTVSNIKGLYRDLLSYFATRQDKLFILVTAPPVTSHPDQEFVPGSAARARAINTWLVHHWLDNYPYNNVAVFDFFNVLTSNNGDIDTNDLGLTTGNHHRLLAGKMQYVIQTANNYSAYASGSDSHPSEAGSLKAAGEFVPLLNVAYHAWKGTGGKPLFMGRSPKSLTAVSLLLLD
jgi:hypothetical protein